MANFGMSQNAFPSAQTPRTTIRQSKRKVTAISAKDYMDKIATHAQLEFGQSLYPGSNYAGLANYLSSGSETRPNGDAGWRRQIGPVPPDHPVYVHDLTLEEGNAKRIVSLERPEDFTKYCDQQGQKRQETQGDSPCLLVFIRGKPSATWLSTIGWKFDVDPEFWLRHLDSYLQPNDNQFFTQPALPSSSRNIIRLKIPTIGYRNHENAYSQKVLEELRVKTSQELTDYRREFHKAETGTSIVRSFAIHDLHHFSLEQEISVSVTDFEGGWAAVVLLDSGNDLAAGSPGSWTSKPLRTNAWKASFTPTLMHHKDIALLTPTLKRTKEKDNVEGLSPPHSPRQASPQPPIYRVKQCSLLLPRHYGRFLHENSSRKSPLYALRELFIFSATAVSQLLNMLEKQIDAETDRLLQNSLNSQEREELHSAVIANFVYNKSILVGHIDTLRANVKLLEDTGGREWISSNDEPGNDRLAGSRKAVLTDFEFLLHRASRLSKSCDRGINIAGSNAAVVESKRASQQAAYVSRLTLLAFLYIPATFSTSIFGMNLEQLGQGTNSSLIYIWLGALMGLYIVTYLVWRVNLSVVLQSVITWIG